MKHKALYVGGCAAPYHRFEPTLEPIITALAAGGVATTTGGMFHPDGGDATAGDYGILNAANLAHYDALVLFTTGHDSGEDAPAIVDYVEQGGALVGIHCAADSFKNHQPFISLLGGSFRDHPAPLDVALEFADTLHPITQGLQPFTVHDELYLFNHYDAGRVHLLAETHSHVDKEGIHAGAIPLCWTREQGKGRVFYLSLGHFPQVMQDAAWRALFQRGVQWALREI